MKISDYLDRWNELLLIIGQFLSRPRSDSSVRKIQLTMFGFTFLLITYLLSFPYIGTNLDFKLGDRPANDIRVPHDVRHELVENTIRMRKDAYRKRKFVFDRDYNILNTIFEKIEDEFEVIAQAVSTQKSLEASRLDIVKAFPLYRNFNPADLIDALRKPNRKQLSSWAKTYATVIFDRFGIYSQHYPKLRSFYSVGATVRTINSQTDHEELLFDSDQIIHYKAVFGRAYNRLSSLGDEAFRKRLSAGAKRLVIRRILQLYYNNPYLVYNAVETKRRKEEAAQMIPPVTRLLKKGTIIVKAEEVIDQNKFRQIEVLRKSQQKVSAQFVTGMFLIQLMLALAVFVFIYRFSELKLADLSSHIMLHSLLLIIILFAFFMSRFNVTQTGEVYFALFIPVIFLSTMLALLFSNRLTMIIGIYISIFLFMLSNYDAATLIISFISVIAGIYTAEKMEKRSHFMKGALIAGFSTAFVVIGMDLVQNQVGFNTSLKISYAFFNGFFSLVLTLGLLPLYETVFNLATKFRLMELADFNNTLLQKIAHEAPSTYTHSLGVAALSERAVSAIEGDVLLTRVGCLYHDIGKTVNPSFYAENKHLYPTNESFRKLGPLKSAQVIIAHVIDGIRMGREARLPEKIISFIPEHHGTSTIQFFFHKALLEGKRKRRKKSLPRELFQYPGPIPETKETGVVMIADSVEAASRTLQSSSRENLEELVEQIIQNKLNENQFDNCPLTISDLSKVKKAFVDVLESTFHGRPIYPSQRETDSLEKQATRKKKSRKK